MLNNNTITILSGAIGDSEDPLLLSSILWRLECLTVLLFEFKASNLTPDRAKTLLRVGFWSDGLLVNLSCRCVN